MTDNTQAQAPLGGRLGRLVRDARSLLPSGGTLPLGVWRRRHRGIVVLLWLHVPALIGFGLVRGRGPVHLLVETAPVAVLAGLSGALRQRRRLSTVIAALGLMTCSAILVHLSGGVIEMHFHFFVMVGVVALYQDWWPFLVAIGYVVVQHGVGGALWPEHVYNHPAAVANPWKWAGIHGFFILGLSAAGVLSWRLNEAMRRAELAKEQQLAEAQHLARLGSWEWLVSSDKVTWSEELYRIVGVEPESFEPSYEGFMERVHPEDRERVEATVHRSLERREGFEYRCRIARPDGEVAWIEARGNVVLGPDGQLERLVGTAMDVTERYVLEKMKREFVSVVSHELRTPLASVRGSLGLLAGGVLGPLPENGQRMVDIAVTDMERLVRLVNDIVDMEQVELGELALNRKPCSARQLLDEAITAVEGMAAERGVTLTAEADDERAWADRERVRQALTNLLSNAIKFSPAGTTVTVRAGGGDGEVVFEVTDTGPGIPEDQLETIFGRFQQLDGSNSREKGGAGLGLAITKSIVESHDGRIWAESKVGEGSTFAFSLPAAAPSRAEGALR